MSDWVEKHSVNCYFCDELVDERECTPADEYNNNDGGEICPKCLAIGSSATQNRLKENTMLGQQVFVFMDGLCWGSQLKSDSLVVLSK